MYMQGATPTVSGAFDADGVFFPLDSCKQTINKDGSGAVTSIVATDGKNTWTQTFTTSAGQLVISQWKKS